MSNSKFYPWNWFNGNTTIEQAKGAQSGAPRTKVTEQSKVVNFDSAMQLSAWWAGLERWSNVVSSLPIKIQEFDGTLWQDNNKTDLALLFNGKVNRYQTKTEFFLTLMLNFKSFGNAYVVKSMSTSGRITSMFCLASSQVEIKVLEDGSQVFIHTHDGVTTAYSDKTIWHIKGFGNGSIGLNTMSFASNAISIGLSGEDRVSKTFKNAGKPQGILKYDGELTAEQRQMLKTEFADLLTGDSLMVLEKEFEYDQTQMTAADMQLLESRRFQIEDIGRFLDIPSVLINDTANSTVWGAGISEVINGWYKLSLRPTVLLIAESMKVNLISPAKRGKTRILFDFDDLLRLNRKERSEAQAKEIQSGITVPNEAREENNRQPHPSGNELMINTAILPIKTVLEQRDEAETTTD
jgi:HK97 family phage portal protein